MDHDQRLDDVLNDVPMTRLRIFMINLGSLTHLTNEVDKIEIAEVKRVYGLLEGAEHDFYYWMQQVAGDPGKIFAANLYRDISHLYLSVIRKTTPAIYREKVEKYCSKCGDHCGVLDKMIRMHFILNDREPPPMPEPRKFRVALSFAGEKRAIVSQIADMLTLRFSEGEVLYDNYHTHIWAQPNLDTILPPLYRTQSDLIVVFICSNYAEKEWCGLEMRHIRTLIKEKQGHRIMLLRFDNTEVEGIESIDGYINIKDMHPLAITKKILARYDYMLTAS